MFKEGVGYSPNCCYPPAEKWGLPPDAQRFIDDLDKIHSPWRFSSGLELAPDERDFLARLEKAGGFDLNYGLRRDCFPLNSTAQRRVWIPIHGVIELPFIGERDTDALNLYIVSVVHDKEVILFSLRELAVQDIYVGLSGHPSPPSISIKLRRDAKMVARDRGQRVGESETLVGWTNTAFPGAAANHFGSLSGQPIIDFPEGSAGADRLDSIICYLKLQSFQKR